MRPETEKYLRKRKQIINIIESIRVNYESDEVYIETHPDFWEARKAAEKIMAKIGINKPKELEEMEGPGSAIGPTPKKELRSKKHLKIHSKKQ